jgi:hypothetical protein
MKTLTLTLLLTAISLGLFSQSFDVPKNLTLNKAEDYAPFEQDILNCFEWLMKTPLNEHIPKRKEANAFLINWLSGSPNVKIEIKREIVTFNSPDLLIIFLGGWAKYSLESKDFQNKKAGSLAGIESVIEFYTRNKEYLPGDKNVEKYIKMQNRGKLKGYIDRNA